MIKCVRITGTLKTTDSFLERVQKAANNHKLEGSFHVIQPDTIRVIICGQRDNVEALIDVIYKEANQQENACLDAEPFLKDRDYRGVFRIIS